MLCFRNVPEAKKFMANRVRGASRFSVETSFHLTVPKNSRGGGGIGKCFNKFGCRNSLDKRAGEYQDFPPNFFCLTVPKVFIS